MKAWPTFVSRLHHVEHLTFILFLQHPCHLQRGRKSQPRAPTHHNSCAPTTAVEPGRVIFLMARALVSATEWETTARHLTALPCSILGAWSARSISARLASAAST